MMPSDDLRARVLFAAQGRPSPTRPQGKRIAGVAAFVSIGIAVAIISSLGGVGHTAGRPLAMTIELASGWALASAVLTWIVLDRRGSTLSRRPFVLAIAALVAPIAVFCWMQMFHGAYEEPFQRVGYRCLMITVAIAAVPLATFMFLRRGIEPRRPSALGAAAGAACGAWGGVGVDLWCPLTNPAHVLVGHVAPIALLIAVGALVGSRLLRRA